MRKTLKRFGYILFLAILTHSTANARSLEQQRECAIRINFEFKNLYGGDGDALVDHVDRVFIKLVDGKTEPKGGATYSVKGFGEHPFGHVFLYLLENCDRRVSVAERWSARFCNETQACRRWELDPDNYEGISYKFCPPSWEGCQK